MPRYYCDYCDTYLTHDSPSVRKQHNAGYKHKSNVRTYYQQFEEQQTQSLIDQRIKEHLGQAAAFQQVGANFHRLTSLPSQGPHIPILPTPILPIPGSQPRAPPFLQGMRPPVFTRPPGAAPGYGTGQFGPGMQQMNGLPMPPPPPPPMINPSPIMGTTAQTSGSAPPSLNPPMYQEGPTPTSAGYNAYQVLPSMGTAAATTSKDDS